MNMARQLQQRSMFASFGPGLSKSGDGRISGSEPGCSSGVPPVYGWPNIGSALAAGVEQPQVVGPGAAEAGALTHGERRVPVVVRGQAGSGEPVERQLR